MALGETKNANSDLPGETNQRGEGPVMRHDHEDQATAAGYHPVTSCQKRKKKLPKHRGIDVRDVRDPQHQAAAGRSSIERPAVSAGL